jgi:hypothetical protein
MPVGEACGFAIMEVSVPEVSATTLANQTNSRSKD